MIKFLRLFGWGRALLLLLAIWLCVLLIAATPLFRAPQSQEPDAQTVHRLAQAFSELEILKKQNAELKSLFSGVNIGDGVLPDGQFQDLKEKLIQAEQLLNGNRNDGIDPKEEPSAQYERTRRKILNDAREIWYFVKAEAKKMQQEAVDLSPSLATKLTHLLEMGVEHKRSLLNDIEKLAVVDGYAGWREKESNELSDLIQRRLKFLQNPPDCNIARKLVCNLNKGCGFGCQLHHVIHCFIIAYGTQRTLILKSKGWRYHKAGWEDVFLPISETCTDLGGATRSHWPGNADTQVVDVPIIDSLSPRAPYLPRAIPLDLAPRLERLHGDPIVWWIGQFLKYLMRPTESTQTLLQEAETKLGFKKPIVGVHIRRTDKVGTEASFHSLDEYMGHVEEYYNQLESKQKVDKRRIYLASDDPRVIFEAKKNYPHYEIIGDPSVAKTASVSLRYTGDSLKGIIIDVNYLALSDYLVCTFSSQVCRLAYEIMQTLYPDASDRFRSLDDIFYYGGQSSHNRVAVLPHRAHAINEMDLEVGDLVGVAGNHWNGYSKGKNRRTNQVALYPSFKVDEVFERVEFPTYPEVPLKVDSSNT